MTAKVVNIKLDKGCDFSKTLSFTDDNDSVVNLTGFALTMGKIRKHPTSSSPAPLQLVLHLRWWWWNNFNDRQNTLCRYF